MPAKIINAITTALVAVVVVFALLIVAGKPFGFHAYAVLSGSMEPAYHTGSLIYVKEVKPSALGPGDVITFMTGKDATVTHRIVEEVQCEDGVTRFQTQGDANTSPDGELVHPDNVVGTPVIQIPALGYVVNFVQFPPGTYIAISVGAIAVFLMFLPDLFPSRKDDEEAGEDERAEDSKPRRSLRDMFGRRGGEAEAGAPQYAKAHAAYAQAGNGAGEYGRPVYAQRPHGHQARPMGQRPQAAGQQTARPMQQPYPGQQRPLPQRVGVQQQARPAQAQRPAIASRPAGAATATASRPAAGAATAAGANNPRFRNQAARPTQAARPQHNAAQTHQTQGSPARRPVR